MMLEPEPDRPSWSFLTNHAHVLLAISRNPELRQRDISYLVGITPGAVHRIVHELEESGYLRHERVGRRNRYEILDSQPLRHPLEANVSVAELLGLLSSQD
jgi:DNA-binding Lrp family transcriptional regulator